MEGNDVRLGNVVWNIHQDAQRHGISFESIETRRTSENRLKELFLKKFEMISRRYELSEKSKYQGHVGQSKESEKYYKKESKQAKKDLRELNKQIDLVEKEFGDVLTKLRNYKT